MPWKDDIRELEDVPVFSVVAIGGLEGIGGAWERLEEPLESLRGRRYYGTYMLEQGEYRACFEALGGDPEFEGLERWTVPGGRYARRKLVDWREDTGRIGAAFTEMAEHFGEEGDEGRPSIEHYRSRREVVLYFPLR